MKKQLEKTRRALCHGWSDQLYFAAPLPSYPPDVVVVFIYL